MGAKLTFIEKGKKNSSTVFTNDKNALKTLNMDKIPIKITQIRVWHKQHVKGFECYYDHISAGASLGFGYQSAKMYDIVLADDEYITRIIGTYDSFINSLTFHTSKDRVMMIGTGNGNYFNMARVGKVVKYFKIGFSQQMDTIGAYFERNPELKGRHIRRHSTSILTSSATAQHKLEPFANSVHSGEKAGDDFSMVHDLEPIEPRAMTTRMHSGHDFDLEHEVEPDPVKAEPCLQLPVPMAVDPNNLSLLHGTKSNVAGKSYSESTTFDDFTDAMRGHNYVILKEVRVVHDQN